MRIVIKRGDNRRSFTIDPKGSNSRPNIVREQQVEDLKTFICRPALFRATRG